MAPIILNKFGHAVWRHKRDKNLLVDRPYDWCDHVLVIDETHNRTVVDSGPFSTFDFTDWVPVTVKEWKEYQ